ncbi:MAG: hypothetical protein Tsb0032_39480 [Kiloniellaceae bacterium]
MSAIRTACPIVVILMLTGALSGPVDAGFAEGLAASRAGDHETALREWQPLAEAGDAAAQYNIALMYQRGEGVRQDYAEALRWYRLAAEQG